jgi:hypothetical protein
MYRVVSANSFRYRAFLGETLVTFCSNDENFDTQPPTAVLKEEVAVNLSWPQAKALLFMLQEALEVVENKLGPVPMTNNAGFSVNIKEHVENSLNAYKAVTKPL